MHTLHRYSPVLSPSQDIHDPSEVDGHSSGFQNKDGEGKKAGNKKGSWCLKQTLQFHVQDMIQIVTTETLINYFDIYL